jgi:hypothetical protein
MVPYHVVKNANLLKFSKNGQVISATPDWKLVQDDVAIATFPSALVNLGLKKACPAYVDRKVRATIVSRGLAAVGNLEKLNQRFGYYYFDANTKPGFSGAALVQEHKNVYAMHLGYVSSAGRQISFAVDLALLLFKNGMVYSTSATFEPESPIDDEDEYEDSLEFEQGGTIRMRKGKYFLEDDERERLREVRLERERVDAEERAIRREEEFAHEMEEQLSRVAANMHAKGWEFTESSKRHLRNKVRRKFGYEEESAQQLVVTVAPTPPDSECTREKPQTIVTTCTRVVQAGEMTKLGKMDKPVQCNNAKHQLVCYACEERYHAEHGFAARFKNLVAPIYRPEMLSHTPDTAPEAESFLAARQSEDLRRQVQSLRDVVTSLSNRLGSGKEFSSQKGNGNQAQSSNTTQPKKKKSQLNTGLPKGITPLKEQVSTSTGV